MIASFRVAPEPSPPTCSMRRHNCSRMGLARATSACSPPTSANNLPSRAGPTLPPTGHSTKAAPRCDTDAPIDRIVSGRTVLISITSFPVSDASGFTIDRFARRVVEQHHNDGFAVFDEFRRRRESLGSRLGERIGLRHIAVPDSDLVSHSHQSLRDRRSHPSRAAYADSHALPRSGLYLFALVRTIDAEMLRGQLFAIFEFAGLAVKHAAPRVQNDGPIRNFQG